MQISITVDLIFKKIILYAELTTVETISLVAPSQSENLVHRVTRWQTKAFVYQFYERPLTTIQTIKIMSFSHRTLWNYHVFETREIALFYQHLRNNVNSVSNLNPIKTRRKLVWPYEILFRMFDDDDINFCAMI